MKTTGRPLQFACFGCRKCFKRPQFMASHDRFMTSEQREGQSQEVKQFEIERNYKCPDCGGQSHYMGLDFKAPKKSDIKGWAYAQATIESGKLFHRGANLN